MVKKIEKKWYKEDINAGKQSQFWSQFSNNLKKKGQKIQKNIKKSHTFFPNPVKSGKYTSERVRSTNLDKRNY